MVPPDFVRSLAVGTVMSVNTSRGQAAECNELTLVRSDRSRNVRDFRSMRRRAARISQVSRRVETNLLCSSGSLVLSGWFLSGPRLLDPAGVLVALAQLIGKKFPDR